MRSVTEVICFGCKHLIKYPKCKAFKKIPQSIRDGDNDHSKPLKNQGNETVFESIDVKK
jgi:hypothetical protein